MTVAALFVLPNGPYSNLEGVDAWVSPSLQLSRDVLPIHGDLNTVAVYSECGFKEPMQMTFTLTITLGNDAMQTMDKVSA